MRKEEEEEEEKLRGKKLWKKENRSCPILSFSFCQNGKWFNFTPFSVAPFCHNLDFSTTKHSETCFPMLISASDSEFLFCLLFFRSSSSRAPFWSPDVNWVGLNPTRDFPWAQLKPFRAYSLSSFGVCEMKRERVGAGPTLVCSTVLLVEYSQTRLNENRISGNPA